MTLKAIVVGNVDTSWATETHLGRDLAKIPGVEVHGLQVPQHPDEAFLTVLEHAGSEADVLIYAPAVALPPIETAAIWKRLDRRGTLLCGYHLDVYRGLKRASTVNPERSAFWSLPVVFTADGSGETELWMKELGIDHRWLPAACVSDECIEVDVRPEWQHEVVFVGMSGHYHREWPWRGQMLQALRAHYGERFAHYDHGSGMRDLRLNALVQSARVVVGDSLCLPGFDHYWSDRYYETIGRGGFLVAPHVPGIDEHFTNGRHLAFYASRDTDSLLNTVDLWLGASRDASRAIAREGQEHVRRHHTYVQRAETLLRELAT